MPKTWPYDSTGYGKNYQQINFNNHTKLIYYNNKIIKQNVMS